MSEIHRHARDGSHAWLVNGQIQDHLQIELTQLIGDTA